jgi:tetratricopeptide (TPR) repeat protein
MRIGSALDRRHFLAGTFLAFTAGLAVPRLPAQESDLNKTRRIAETQHDIVMILIKKKEFTKAAEEADKIFEMKWPESQEAALKKCLLDFSDLFRHDQHPEIALRLLDKHMNVFKSNKNRAEILMDKAYVLEGMGRHDEALECFREAKRLLEIKNSPPTIPESKK